MGEKLLSAQALKNKDGGQILIKQAISVEIKGQDKPALIGECLLDCH